MSLVEIDPLTIGLCITFLENQRQCQKGIQIIQNIQTILLAMLTYASSWSTLIAMPRNMNFSLEALCVSGLIAGTFGWRQNNSWPVFWISAFCLSLGIFLRPSFAFFYLYANDPFRIIDRKI